MTVAALYVDPRGPYPRMAAGHQFHVLGPHGEDHCRSIVGPREIDCWAAPERDARLYDGPHPVVAHPPCKHWGRLSHLAHVKCNDRCGWSGPKSELDSDGDCPNCGADKFLRSDADCAQRAVEQVRAFGGVLEHPAHSKLWEACGLPHVLTLDRDGTLLQMADIGDEIFLPAICDEFGGYAIEVNQVEWGHVARKPTWLYLVSVPRGALEAPPFPGRQPTHWASGFKRASHPTRPRYDAVPPGIKICSAEQRRRTPVLFAEYLVRLARAAGEARRIAAAA